MTERTVTDKSAINRPQDAAISRMEQWVAEDPRERGIAKLVQWGALQSAAQLLLEVCQAKRGPLVVVSGFYLAVPEKGETDGPPGAKAIGQALQALGGEVIYLTDAPHGPLFEAMGLDVLLYDETANDSTTARLLRIPPACLISTERPGRAADGHYYSMSGRDLSAHTAPIDTLFLEAPAARIPTVAIGDGGNEIGMGVVRDLVIRDVPHGEQIASIVRADHLIVAGVSNFGAYALVGALSRLSGRDLLPSREQAEADIRACVDAGACDGHTFRNEMTVDGMPAEASLELIARLRTRL